MFEKVLVGVDFRAGGRDAIALASKLVDRGGSLTLVHAYPGTCMPSHALAPGVVREERESARQQIARERADAGVEAELIVAEGLTPGRVLHEQAEACGADLIALGSCHRGFVGRAMVGDATRASLNGAPCAIAVAPAGYSENRDPFASIGVGYDGSPDSEVALGVARKLAERTNATIRAVHIVSLASYAYEGFSPLVVPRIAELVDEADAHMKAIEGVEGHAELGLVGDDLAAFGKQVDLLVVGSRGYGPWGRLVHGSTSGQLVRSAGGPLLIVPRDSRPEETNGSSTASSRPAVPA